MGSRVDHFRSVLRSLQGSTSLPEDLPSNVSEILGLARPDCSNAFKIIQILKASRNIRYAEYVQRIPRMSPDEEESIVQMYVQIIRKHHSISMHYCIVKIMQLLKLPNACYTSPYSIKKTESLDRMWKTACEDLRWRFIP